MKCKHCNKKKARRKCPCVEYICPACCATARGDDLDCPPECPYFIKGQHSEAQRHLRHRQKVFDIYDQLEHHRGRAPMECISGFEEGLLMHYYEENREFLDDDEVLWAVEYMEKSISPIHFDQEENRLAEYILEFWRDRVNKENISLEIQRLALETLKKAIPGNQFMKALVGYFAKVRDITPQDLIDEAKEVKKEKENSDLVLPGDENYDIL